MPNGPASVAPSPLRPILICSWNGLAATARAAQGIAEGAELLPAIVDGIQLIEDDPEEMSVGYGGLPNEDGEVELDAAVMDGPSHRAGAVAGVRGFRHVSALALEVLRRTDHALLVGEGATKFARALGFKQEDLLTPKARAAWLAWKANLSPKDAWLGDQEQTSDFGKALWAGAIGDQHTPPLTPEPVKRAKPNGERIPHTTGTIHMSGLDARGNLAAVTSTSGLSYKIAGRVGDSPIVGAGLYCDNDIGSAGSTGRGEAVLQCCGASSVVNFMESGLHPQEACLKVLKKIADRTREKRLLNANGHPAFNVTLYALRKDGLTGCASMHEGYTHIVYDGRENKVLPNAFLFAK
ncbi:MAG: N(4)-(beta-N-acetylglucosaminyl)-L-asparaginase [Phycisphaerales bacterium]|nr:N(4)-(beta-N-acetylglucosaminyl)-L-asparaginase [Phycisphaerales bacterium]